MSSTTTSVISSASEELRLLLSKAIQNGDLGCVKHIFYTEPNIDVNQKLINPQSYLVTATPLMLASQFGQVSIVEFFLDSCPSIVVSMRDKWGRTALNHACEHGHLEIVKILIQNGIDVSSDTTLKGMTALMHAASGGHLEIVKYLVESCGCSPFVQCENGLTAPMWAYTWKRYSVVEFFEQSTFHFLCHEPHEAS